MLYNAHKNGARLIESYKNCTLFQQTFLSLMSVNDINHENKVESYLKALCESMGVKFK